MLFGRKFNLKAVKGQGELVISCAGKLSEPDAHQRLGKVIHDAAEQAVAPLVVVLELSKISAVDSASLSKLTTLASTLQIAGHQLHFRGCPIDLIESMVTIVDLGVCVRSVLVPYACPSCQREVAVLTEVSSTMVDRVQREQACATCGALMDLDTVVGLFEMLQQVGAQAPTFVGANAPPDVSPTIEGEEIPGQYLLESLLGTGASGRVYLATQLSLNRRAAVKIVTATSGAIEAYFRNEARAISRLSHPNIVAVYDFGELEAHRLFLAMEYVKGRNLRQLLEVERKLGLPVAVDVAQKCATALAYAHASGVIHRDLKPENIMVAVDDGRPVVKILDFGLASLREEARAELNQVVGTPAYIAPEIWLGEAASSKSDQYSLGLVLHEIVTGRPAFPGPTLPDHRNQHLTQVVGLASKDHPEAACLLLDPVIARMTSRDAAERYPDMETVAGELARVSSQLGALVPPPGMPVVRDATPAPVNAILVAADPAAAGPLVDALRTRGIDVAGPRRLEDVHAPLLALVEPGETVGAVIAEDAPGLAGRRALVSTSVPVTHPRAMAMLREHPHIVLGRRRPDVIAAALRAMGNRGASPFDYLTTRTAQFLTLTDSEHRDNLVECVADHLRSCGVREMLVRRVTRACDELVINALFHAPRTPQGTARYHNVDRSVPIRMDRGCAPIVRWTLEDDWVALSVRDCYGSMSAERLRTSIGRIGGQRERPGPDAVGMGMGLPTVIKDAVVTVIRIVEQEYTDVVALFDTRRTAPLDEERTACVLFDVAPERLEAVGNRPLGKNLMLRIERDGEGPIARLQGKVDETCDLRPLFTRSGVRIDLGGVTSLNSTGILGWLNARRHRPEIRLRFQACSPAFIETANAVDGFVMNGEVQSLHVPFLCERCNAERSIVYEVRTLLAELRGPGLARRCPTCGGAMALDGNPEEYFWRLAQVDR